MWKIAKLYLPARCRQKVLTLADGGALVLLEGGPGAVVSAQLGRRAVAQALPAAEPAGSAPGTAV